MISDQCLGLVEALGAVLPEAQWQRCVVHFYRHVFTVTPSGKVKEVAAMLKAVQAQEDLAAARQKSAQVAEKLESLKLGKAAQMVPEGMPESLFGKWFLTSCDHLPGVRERSWGVPRKTQVTSTMPPGICGTLSKHALRACIKRVPHLATYSTTSVSLGVSPDTLVLKRPSVAPFPNRLLEPVLKGCHTWRRTRRQVCLWASPPTHLS